MHRPTLLIPALFALTSCNSYINVAEHQARAALARFGGWLHAKADSRDEEIREIGVIHVGKLGEGEEETVRLDVTGAHSAVVIAACDRQCSDLDLRVVTEDGRLVDLDDDRDDTPRVYIKKKDPTELFLKIRMPQCEASKCTYAFKQFEYEDYVGGYGTCFAVDPNGLVMTSFHVVEDAEKINVRFADGRKSDAEIVRSSSDTDLVVLKASLLTPDWLPLAKPSDVKVGTPAFTVGFPSPDMLGSEPKLTEGSVSALSGVEESTMIQISIPIQGGNSGGPVIDYRGRVLGVVESMITSDDDGTPMQLTNFARHVGVASLVLPPKTRELARPPVTSREQAISVAMKAVCQIKTE